MEQTSEKMKAGSVSHGQKVRHVSYDFHLLLHLLAENIWNALPSLINANKQKYRDEKPYPLNDRVKGGK